MAIVFKYTIIYFTLIIHESMSSSINRDLCLETVKRFIDYKWKCNFGLCTAKDILHDVTTCPKKCNFRTSDLHNYVNSLGKIDLTIGDRKKMFNFCSESYNNKIININCSSWNAREYIIWDYAYPCSIEDAHCVHINNYCVCHCLPGYILVDEKCLKNNVPVGGFCSLSKQCTGSNNSGICEHRRCTCAEGFTFIGLACIKRNQELNDSCELTEQCIQLFSVCFQEKCQCMNGYSAFDTDSCLKDTVPVGGFCNLSKQCTGSNNSGICENGRCTCAKEFTSIDLACEKNPPNSLGIGSSNSQQHGTNVGVTLGSLFGGFILGVIVTSVVTTLMYRRLKFRTRKRQEPEFMFAENRKYGTAGGAQISFTNNKKQNVAKLSPYSFSKETQEYNLSRKQEDERTEDVYNHLHEQTEQDNATYDHAFAATNYSADLSDYSNIRDAATVRPTSPSTDGDHYSTLRD